MEISRIICKMLFHSITKKLSLAPESNPYQFRIFIQNESQNLNVNPTFGIFRSRNSY